LLAHSLYGLRTIERKEHLVGAERARALLGTLVCGTAGAYPVGGFAAERDEGRQRRSTGTNFAAAMR